MNTVIAIARELFGLFVDDGALALSVLGVVALTALTVRMAPDMPVVGGGLLVIGCLAILFLNTTKARGGFRDERHGEGSAKDN